MRAEENSVRYTHATVAAGQGKPTAITEMRRFRMKIQYLVSFFSVFSRAKTIGVFKNSRGGILFTYTFRKTIYFQ